MTPRTRGKPWTQVGARADAVLARVRPLLAEGDVALVSHAHFLRVLAARWLGLEPSAGRLLRLDTGTLSTLGTEHGQPVVLMWNAAGARRPVSRLSRLASPSRPRLLPRDRCARCSPARGHCGWVTSSIQLR